MSMQTRDSGSQHAPSRTVRLLRAAAHPVARQRENKDAAWLAKHKLQTMPHRHLFVFTEEGLELSESKVVSLLLEFVISWLQLLNIFESKARNQEVSNEEDNVAAVADPDAEPEQQEEAHDDASSTCAQLEHS